MLPLKSDAVFFLRIFFLLFCVCNQVQAAQSGEAAVATLENDVFTGSDDSYSNGLSLSWVSAAYDDYSNDSVSRHVMQGVDFLPGVNLADGKHYWSWSVSHEMHTPKDISAKQPDPQDQPYAGLLLVDFSLHSLYGEWAQAWNLKLGMVGPSTRAAETQKFVHSVIGSIEPEGWDAQIRDEPVFNLGYLAGFKLSEKLITPGLIWRAIPLVSTELGTYMTMAGGGVLLELGSSGAGSLGICGLSNGVRAACAVGGHYHQDWQFTTYVATGYYRIFHYLPIDGPVFKSGPSAGSEDDPLVNFTSAGFAVRKGSLSFVLGAAYGINPADIAGSELDYGTFTFIHHF